MGGRFLFVKSNMDKKKEKVVKEFAEFILTPKIQVRLATKLSRIPATIKGKTHRTVKKLKTLKPLIDAAEYGKATPSEVEMRAAWDGMRIMIQRAMSGKETVAQAVKTGQKGANEALKAIQKKSAH